MKHIFLSTLCLLSIFSGTFATDDDFQFSGIYPMKYETKDEDIELHVKTENSHLIRPRGRKKHTEKMGKAKKIITGGIYALLVAGCISDMTTIGQSVHDNRTMLALPYNATLPPDDKTCHFSYSPSCNYGLIVNPIECEKYCYEAHHHKTNGKGCYILRECGTDKNDPQIGSGVVSLLTRLFTLTIKFGYDLSYTK